MNPNNYAQTVHLGSYTELQALATAGTLVRGHFYQATDGATARWFMARTASSLEEIKAIPDYVQSVVGTGAIPLSVTNGELSASFSPSSDAGNAITTGTDGKPLVIVPADYVTSVADSTTVATTVTNGELVASAIISTASGNAIEDNNGLYAKKLTVASASAGILSITNDEISFDRFRLTDVHDGSQYNSLSAFVTAFNAGSWTAGSGKQLGTGDFILLKAGTENYVFTGVEGATSVLEQEFVPIEGGEYTTDDIRAKISAGASLEYNNTTGVMSLSLSAMSTNDLSLDSQDKIFINVADTNVSTTDETGTALTMSVTGLFADLYSHIGDMQTNGATSVSNALTKNGNNVKFGGSLIENTTVTMDTYTLAFTGNEVTIEQFKLGAYETDASGNIGNFVGAKRLFIDATNGMLCYIP